MSSKDFSDYKTKTDLCLPFRGEWWVYWGGRAIEDNYHVQYHDQRFAYDFVIKKEGLTHSQGGKRNYHFHCFGQPILAPGDGKVIAALDGIDDNKPGIMNPQTPLGNHIIIDHQNGEFSFMGHFRKGTIGVKPGDYVKQGRQIGECGNSGNSSEAHLHYHLQDTAYYREGNGLPAEFRDYTVEKKLIEKGEPVRGQYIKSMLATIES